MAVKRPAHLAAGAEARDVVGEMAGDVGEDAFRWHAVDLEGVDRGLQVFGPFDQASDARRVAVQPPPQPFDAAELWPERFEFAQQAGKVLQHDEVAADLVWHLAGAIGLQMEAYLLLAATAHQHVRGAGFGPFALQGRKVELRRLEIVLGRQFRRLFVDSADHVGQCGERADAFGGIFVEQQHAVGGIRIQHQRDELDELRQQAVVGDLRSARAR